MDESYWRYGDLRQPHVSSLALKRPRADFDIPGVHDLSRYYSRDDDRLRAARNPLIRDTDSIGASYDRYLQSGQVPGFGGLESSRPLGGGITGHLIDDQRTIGITGMDGISAKSQSVGLGGGRLEGSLPLDASSTLFVEGLPPKCSRREVSHIFRPFVGYREVRIVTKEPRNAGGDPLLLCFVDFLSPAHAASAMDALQGYKFDDQDPDSVTLRLQFARNPGARTGGSVRGKR